MAKLLGFPPIPMPFPNTKGRVRAVRYHDLPHILPGYATDLMGELEISAWELGAGCKNFFTAWQLNLSGLAGGMALSPRRMLRAFRRGLGSADRRRPEGARRLIGAESRTAPSGRWPQCAGGV